MTFAISKVLSFVLEPMLWLLLPLLATVLFCLWSRPRAALWSACTTLVLLVCLSSTALPALLLERLEARHARIDRDADLRAYTGVVVLGGALSDSDYWTTYRQVALNEHAERMTTAVALARRHPHLRILFTGGNGNLQEAQWSEAQRAELFFREQGVDAARMLYESRSRNTYENAVFSARTAGVDTRARWLLLTSAYHMPRAMAVFGKAGWNVTPYPVDYRALPEHRGWLDLSLRQGALLWWTALHEEVGLLAYHLLGWS